MADRDALHIYLSEGWALEAAGVRRKRNGDVTADVMLLNGRIVFQEPAIINTSEGRSDWASRAAGDGRPPVEQMEDALLRLVPDSLELLQGNPQESQADKIVDLVAQLTDEVALWHDTRDEPWGSIEVDGHTEHWPLGSKRFKRWLARRYFEQHNKAPNAAALADAINVLAGKALFEGERHPVFTRIAEHDGRIYIDLADDQWRVVEVDAHGWRVRDNRDGVTVRFRRAAGMEPLPVPVAGGSLDLLYRHVNVKEADRPLVTAWLYQALRPRGPYPTLALYGWQGSSKTTLARIVRALVDPNVAPTRTEPRDERDLLISATNSWVLVIDNISRLPGWLSDGLARLATGGGLATRQLYSDAEEVIFDATRPVVLTGIEEFVIRGDLLDRALVVTLPRIPDDQRKTERDFWAAFEHDRPAILGALLDGVSRALRDVDRVQLDELPRMADFAAWAYAAFPEDERDTFLRAYARNRATANEVALDASVVAATLADFMETRTTWTGTAGELLDKLTALVGEEKASRLRVWPKTPAALRGALDRLAPNLRRADIILDFDVPRESGTGRRIFEVRREPSQPSQPSLVSQIRAPIRDDCDVSDTCDGLIQRSGACEVCAGPLGDDGWCADMSCDGARAV